MVAFACESFTQCACFKSVIVFIHGVCVSQLLLMHVAMYVSLNLSLTRGSRRCKCHKFVKMKPEISETQVGEMKDGYALKSEISEMQVPESRAECRFETDSKQVP